MSTMRAVRIHGYGGPDVLTYEEAPRPSAREGELLIRIDATTVNPFDAAYRAGYLSAYFEPRFPLILGTDIAGTVEDVGQGVSTFGIGDRVYARGGVFRDGAYAQYSTVGVGDAARIPGGLDAIHAAAIPHVALTAWQALFVQGGLSAGQTVLIHGAAGGVGHLAVQLAKAQGARVIGTASVNLDFLDELGVDQAIDYSAERFEEVAGEVDIVLDTIGGDTQERSWSVLRPGGVLVSTVQPPPPEKAEEHGVRGEMVVTAPPIAETLTEIAEMVEAGTITPEVSRILPLEDIREAHELIEQHHTRGKIVLTVT